VELRIGEKILALRQASELTQAELADRASLTKGFISQLENDQTSIGVDSLADILDALGVTLAEFFADSTEQKVVFSPSERVSVDNKGASRFELLVPGSTNNLMDPIMVDLDPGQQLSISAPHAGEQFAYVLSGTATLQLSKQVYEVPAKNCFYFISDQRHQISNRSNKKVSFLWVTTPPQM